MADNDLAIGRMVDAVSHSRYWKSAAIVAVEDDAQDGRDHVDAHRSPVLVVSPYSRHGRIDSNDYDSAAAPATIEELLGMPPRSIFDQRATRMWASFAGRPDLRPYRRSSRRWCPSVSRASRRTRPTRRSAPSRQGSTSPRPTAPTSTRSTRPPGSPSGPRARGCPRRATAW